MRHLTPFLLILLICIPVSGVSEDDFIYKKDDSYLYEVTTSELTVVNGTETKNVQSKFYLEIITLDLQVLELESGSRLVEFANTSHTTNVLQTGENFIFVLKQTLYLHQNRTHELQNLIFTSAVPKDGCFPEQIDFDGTTRYKYPLLPAVDTFWNACEHLVTGDIPVSRFYTTFRPKNHLHLMLRNEKTHTFLHTYQGNGTGNELFNRTFSVERSLVHALEFDYLKGLLVTRVSDEVFNSTSRSGETDEVVSTFYNRQSWESSLVEPLAIAIREDYQPEIAAFALLIVVITIIYIYWKLKRRVKPKNVQYPEPQNMEET